MSQDIVNRIYEISYKHKLSHLGSCLTMVEILEAVFQLKNRQDKFVLSNGHAALALYCVLEKQGGRNAEEIFKHHGVHPDRCGECGIDCSTGSLGNGFPIAAGMALAKPYKTVWVTTSDGEWMEGSMWEALRVVVDKQIMNLKILVNYNGHSAYGTVASHALIGRITGFGAALIRTTGNKQAIMRSLLRPCLAPTVIFVETHVEDYSFLSGLNAHYMIMSKEQYESVSKGTQDKLGKKTHQAT